MKTAALLAYGVVLHALVVYTAMTHPDMGPRIATALGLSATQPMEAETFIAMMRDVHTHMDPAVPVGATIFLGDSITMCLAVSALAPYAVNYGIGWQRSDQLIASIDLYSSLKRAARVVITIGTNDLLQNRDVNGIASRYRTILDRIPATTAIVMSSIPPIGPSHFLNPALTPDRIREVVVSAKAVCEADHRCRFVNAYAALTTQDVAKPGVLLADDIHLTEKGYALWIDALRPAMLALSEQGATGVFAGGRHGTTEFRNRNPIE